MLAQVTLRRSCPRTSSAPIRPASIPFRPPPSGRSRLDGGACGVPPGRYGGECRKRRRIELLGRAQGCRFPCPMQSSAPLERGAHALRGAWHLQDDHFFAPISRRRRPVALRARSSAATSAALPECKEDPMATRLDNSRRHPFSHARTSARRAGSPSAVAHADEQSRSRGGRETARTCGLWRHRPRGARLGEL